MQAHHQQTETLRRASKPLPSIEAQTVEFIERSRASKRARPARVEWAGFSVYLRYQKQTFFNGHTLHAEVLVIANVNIPPRFQRRGWFWRYCQLCAALADDGIIIECVINDDLLAALRSRTNFVEFQDKTFLFKKSSPMDWQSLTRAAK